MNVLFHVLTGAAVATTMAARQQGGASAGRALAGFVLGIGGHGVLDMLPHQYPLRTVADVVVSSGLIACVMVAVRPQFLLLTGMCLLGSVFPDLVDLGPHLLNRVCGPVVPELPQKLFPWHTPRLSGSIFDGSRMWLSHGMHALVLGCALATLWRSRQAFRCFEIRRA